MSNILAKKSLGQNFLKDENILKKIADEISVTEKDLLIEIGPGTGALTKYLVKKGCDVLCYEIDRRMESILKPLIHSNVQIIFDDFLKRDLTKDIKKKYDNIYVVANIPYYITTPIIEHLIKSEIVIEQMVLLVQKEVALRFVAKPKTKDYSYFSLYLQHYYSIKILFDVSPQSFVPSPKVTSSVVKFVRKPSVVLLDEEKFFLFLKAAFSHKRKTLRNNLSEYSWEKIWELLVKKGYSQTVRAEEISYVDFVDIFKEIDS